MSKEDKRYFDLNKHGYDMFKYECWAEKELEYQLERINLMIKRLNNIVYKREIPIKSSWYYENRKRLTREEVEKDIIEKEINRRKK